jgi:AraC-like DNA-binding protein
MSIRHKLKNCFCQRDGKRPAIDYREYVGGETETICTSAHEIIFVVEGSIHMHAVDAGGQRLMEKGDFVYMPMGVRLTYKASAESAFLTLRLEGMLPECHIFRINKPRCNTIDTSEELYVLASNIRVREFVGNLVGTIKDGMTCEHYMKAKVTEMFYLLHAYYSEDECKNFFSHISTPDMAFSEFVRLNFLKYRNVDELAAALNMTKQRFNSKFKQIFQSSPREWMMRNKSRLIYQDICQSHKSLKEIAFEYNFSASTNFVRYCRTVFGKSPREIRRDIDVAE